ncbi:MAG: FAD-binding oxidoreductase [Gemmatimonadota bacterium]|nr:FAD-binding oxidoreductase [Gemmatimonadota bacterium]
MTTIVDRNGAGYDATREVWNARFDRRPAEIVRVEEPADVAFALRRASERGLDVCVKSGGHDYAGNSSTDGGLLIDLGQLRSIVVDPERRRAVVGPGATWAEVDAVTQEHGLATPGGTVSSVGVAGFTLGGGEGWLSRKHGCACDNLMAVEVVTASGDTVRVSEEENPDLLWGLRGGGGNFGVVTSLELALHPLDHDILSGQIIYPFDRAADLLVAYRDYFAGAPDEASCYPFVYRVPPLDVFPEEWHGDLVLAFVFAYMGPPADAEREADAFRGHDGMLLDGLERQSYVSLQTAFDAAMGKGSRWYTRAHYFDALTDGAIDALVANIEPLPGELTTVYFGPAGGAMGRRPVDATAYPHRTATHALHVFPGWTDASDDAEVMAWTRQVSDAVAPHANGGVYVNLLADDEVDRVPAAYGANLDRLTRLKAKWDPDNVFRTNHNIPPRP